LRRMPKGGIKALKPEVFTGIYAEIAAQTDSETAMKLYAMLHGQTLTFPQKLYSREYVRSFVREHAEEYTVREIAKMFGYSDRRIRQFIAEETDRADSE